MTADIEKALADALRAVGYGQVQYLIGQGGWPEVATEVAATEPMQAIARRLAAADETADALEVADRVLDAENIAVGADEVRAALAKYREAEQGAHVSQAPRLWVRCEHGYMAEGWCQDCAEREDQRSGRLMSVALTEQAVLDRRKTVTRRTGWRFLQPGDRLTLCRKVQGRKPGEPLVRLAKVEVVSVRREPLHAITDDDVRREGIGTDREDFLRFYIEHMGGSRSQCVTRIEWRYLDER